MLGWYKPGQRVHVGHGMYRFKDTKMSTRKGNVIWLEEVLKEAEERAFKLTNDRDTLHENQKELAKAVGIGAIKWNDLKRSANQDIIFDWDDILNMQGNSGPYMQYTYVRTQSIMRAAEVTFNNEIVNYQLNEDESSILRTLAKYNEYVQLAARDLAPHLLANYLFNLAQKYNLFYQKNPILKAEEQSKQFRLLLTASTAQVLKNGLNLLGIKTVEKM
jgi:arginyl-tRNA synthetase